MPSIYIYLIKQVIIAKVSVGISLLLFPPFGILADLYLTRYRTIQISLLILTSVIVLTLAVDILVVLNNVQTPYNWEEVGFGVAILCIIASTGLFEANAIQFGTDQLLEAPSTQLSSFIRWYFWSTHLGQQVVFCMAISIGAALLPF